MDHEGGIAASPHLVKYAKRVVRPRDCRLERAAGRQRHLVCTHGPALKRRVRQERIVRGGKG